MLADKGDDFHFLFAEEDAFEEREDQNIIFFALLPVPLGKAGKVGFVGVSDAPGIVPGGRESGRTAPMDEVIDAWRGVLEQLGEAFRAGAAAVDPKDRNSTCQHCHLPTLCRISRPRDFAGDAAGVAGMSEGPDD